VHSFSEYFLLMEKVGWRLTDFDFDAIDLENISDTDRQKLRDTAITESAVPHYADTWGQAQDFERFWELRQFAVLWTAEEHRHSEGLRMLAERVGVTPKTELEAVSRCDFPAIYKDACPSNCYTTVPGILTYTVMQELVTWKFYLQWSKATKSTFLKAFLAKLAADEMRHHRWFANALQRYLPLVEDQHAYRRAIADAVAAFKMPHNYLPAEFPAFDMPEVAYFTDEDFADMKEKIVKILMFDGELVGMLMEMGDDALATGLISNAKSVEQAA